jgi:hypothetical protein
MAAKRPRTRRGLPAAIGLGLAGGMRTFVPLATIALRDRQPSPGLARLGIVLASAGELVVDKLPSTPSRTEPVGLGGRFVASGSVGWACAGPIGGLLAGSTAVGSAFLTHGVRRDLGKQTGLPDPVIAVAEDALALLIARLSTRRSLPRPASPTVEDPGDPPGEPPTAPKTEAAAASRPARGRAGRPRRRPCRLCRRSRR